MDLAIFEDLTVRSKPGIYTVSGHYNEDMRERANVLPAIDDLVDTHVLLGFKGTIRTYINHETRRFEITFEEAQQ